eukprot:CAMPEP_0114591890 /NCGR_PEP_ID=MMETSP0125-20121206/13841_1 /TAXON_ID=485358 ORGANISM="Aristerostoma sp., Strain ATCC 50986" /NCGR_SAMPLE_ID=MMETSP0125 /ASSEMBLY_ACC=CAM_ASM_000245 /LENGTH=69 /DNA_ID=CAMNT_0001790235 /DNA_START=1969 /DNA_END=2178 /DNA_ORIENTATION=-
MRDILRLIKFEKFDTHDFISENFISLNDLKDKVRNLSKLSGESHVTTAVESPNGNSNTSSDYNQLAVKV